ncbi:MAG: hypothetical protein AAGE92_14925, partial [Cyanobacteria bacterium P01_G01_bin.4]
NLRTQLDRMLKRIGFPKLEKPFNNLRASARYDLEQSMKFTPDELNAWFGHSEQVARAYYGRIGEEAFEKAAEYAHSPAHSPLKVAGVRRRSQKSKSPGKAAYSDAKKVYQHTPEDSNL